MDDYYQQCNKQILLERVGLRTIFGFQQNVLVPASHHWSFVELMPPIIVLINRVVGFSGEKSLVFVHTYIYIMAGLTALNIPSKVVSVCLGKNDPASKAELDGMAHGTTEFVLIRIEPVIEYCLERQILIESLIRWILFSEIKAQIK